MFSQRETLSSQEFSNGIFLKQTTTIDFTLSALVLMAKNIIQTIERAQFKTNAFQEINPSAKNQLEMTASIS